MHPHFYATAIAQARIFRIYRTITIGASRRVFFVFVRSPISAVRARNCENRITMAALSFVRDECARESTPLSHICSVSRHFSVLQSMRAYMYVRRVVLGRDARKMKINAGDIYI